MNASLGFEIMKFKKEIRKQQQQQQQQQRQQQQRLCEKEIKENDRTKAQPNVM